ncbi:MAG: bifunctional NADH-specific enoyl-ACP reductase/trans-2-enoyl-CoA reductase, partial [Porticoccus sp.]|nr:bifunctional NADH-specific enoyl-ACP reductase/trans-2-enoyl-CoA reductase [Porticoccus sp.]
INTDKEEIQEFSLEAASDEDISNTVAVMGGEDWQMWMDALSEAGVLAEGAKSTAFTYVGEKVTWDLYWDGTIGQAKRDLDKKVIGIREQMATTGGDARVSVLKAVVTQASSAIPIMPLYLSLLFKAMKEDGSHEGCIEQLYRLYTECLYSDNPRLDEEGRLRVDELERRPEIQDKVAAAWAQITTENLAELTDFREYKHEFLNLFGFDVDGVDYDAEVNPLVEIKHLV